MLCLACRIVGSVCLVIRHSHGDENPPRPIRLFHLQYTTVSFINRLKKSIPDERWTSLERGHIDVKVRVAVPHPAPMRVPPVGRGQRPLGTASSSYYSDRHGR